MSTNTDTNTRLAARRTPHKSFQPTPNHSPEFSAEFSVLISYFSFLTTHGLSFPSTYILSNIDGGAEQETPFSSPAHQKSSVSQFPSPSAIIPPSPVMRFDDSTEKNVLSSSTLACAVCMVVYCLSLDHCSLLPAAYSLLLPTTPYSSLIYPLGLFLLSLTTARCSA